MKPEQITETLQQLFSSNLQISPPDSWQIETDNFRLLVLLSEDHSWLRVLIPIAPFSEAQDFLEQLMIDNFDLTLETRYALHQNILWGVFQHPLDSLTVPDFSTAIQRLVSMGDRGLSDCFQQLIETQIRQIIKAAKMQKQTLATTLQTLERFYQEGLMGEMDQGAAAREATLAAWRYQLERLWPEIEP
ncbi:MULTISPECIES: type III secretion system chaperone [Planktothricoides]|uniref:Type III secretion system chaperone n=2 Tax=Planktothricoides raciborskii TaxID=132608 RepID=A0AAU8JBX1_9CYAN|nr:MULTISPECIES: type III secretion system chaperone [Planktothricoides]KOR35575.1 hypothetical protein AM228_17400 [Planktothricoides sp. SR001]MBD2545891.1 type III secretion system chaperone [Planktothricoides raciborskii FACHB-1370]MBD2584149.1 type III secretion system chaperone [Planktothricoides raciborskii FACHB-1261]